MSCLYARDSTSSLSACFLSCLFLYYISYIVAHMMRFERNRWQIARAFKRINYQLIADLKCVYNDKPATTKSSNVHWRQELRIIVRRKQTITKKKGVHTLKRILYSFFVHIKLRLPKEIARTFCLCISGLANIFFFFVRLFSFIWQRRRRRRFIRSFRESKAQVILRVQIQYL